MKTSKLEFNRLDKSIGYTYKTIDHKTKIEVIHGFWLEWDFEAFLFGIIFRTFGFVIGPFAIYYQRSRFPFEEDI